MRFKDFLLREDTQQWLDAKEKGLNLSKEARMKRAEQMGFDTSKVWYRGMHGEGYDNRYLDPRDSGPQATYFSQNPHTASSYAQTGENSSLFTCFLKGKTFTISDETHFNALVEELSLYNQDGEIELAKQARDLMKAGETNYHELEGLFDPIEEIGFDICYVLEEGELDAAVFKGYNIRSVNAVFDPDKSDSSNILD